jgi:hypothetical protein
MTIQTICIDRARSDVEIARGVAEAFGVARESVLVVGDLRDVPTSPRTPIAVLCERRRIAGDFAVQITIYPQDDVLQNCTEQHMQRDIAGSICTRLSVNCLLEGAGPNPYEAVLLPLGDAPRCVLLDADALDNEDALVLARQPAATS